MMALPVPTCPYLCPYLLARKLLINKQWPYLSPLTRAHVHVGARTRRRGRVGARTHTLARVLIYVGRDR